MIIGNSKKNTGSDMRMSFKRCYTDQAELYYKVTIDNTYSGILDKYRALYWISLTAMTSYAEQTYKMIENLFLEEINKDEKFRTILYSLEDLVILAKAQKGELYYQEIFAENCTSILGEDYEIVKQDSKNRKRPDAWIKYKDSEEIPVEMKKHEFNESALNQLQEYMRIYNADRGIAIGQKLTVELPNNIDFISLDVIKSWES